MNKYYQEALSKGKAIAYSANGEQFIRAYAAMTKDMTASAIRDKHRRKQKITIKGIFKEAALE